MLKFLHKKRWVNEENLLDDIIWLMIGEIKLEQYGDDLISIINKYLDLKSIARPEISRIKDDRELIGTKWTVEEEKQLLEEFSNGIKISEIAKLHSRTPGGIRSRLKKLGVLNSVNIPNYNLVNM